MLMRIPPVVFPDDGDLLGVWRPNREVRSAAAVHLTRMRAQLLISAKVCTLAK
jgi:hypothetical protein